MPARAIAAARRAFDTTDWSRDHAFRVRCLRQLHQALLDNVEPLREILVHEVGAPVSSTSGPQLAGPIDVVSWYADLLEGYDFVEDLGERDTFAGRHHRWIEKEAAGVVGAIAAYNYPIQLALAKLAPALAAGLHRRAEGRARHAVGDARARASSSPRRPTSRPGVVNVLDVVGQRGRRRADDAPRRRRRVVHGLDAGRAPDHGRRERDGEARVPRARRQVGVRPPRRRRRGAGGDVLLVRDDLALGSGLRDHVAPRRAPRSLRRGRRHGARRRSPACRTAIRPIPANMMGPLINARQREKVAGYVDRAIADGAKAVIGGRIPEHLPRASSTSRRCSSAPTRTRRSPRTSCSVRCSSCCRTTVTTTRCGSRTTRSSGSPARW